MIFMKEVELTLIAISSSSSQKDHFVLVFEEPRVRSAIEAKKRKS